MVCHGNNKVETCTLLVHGFLRNKGLRSSFDDMHVNFEYFSVPCQQVLRQLAMKMTKMAKENGRLNKNINFTYIRN